MDGHYETIICPECGAVQEARVELDIPFAVYIHDCDKCGYTIMESQWQLYNGKKKD